MAQLLNKIGQIHNTATTDHIVIFQRTMKTLKEMLVDRGFSEFIYTCKTVEEIEEAIKQSNNILHVLNPVSHQEIKVFFCSDEKVGVKHLRMWSEQNDDDNTSIIIVSLDGPTAFTKKETESENCKSNVQFFTFMDLSVNVSKHVLVPKHVKVDKVPEINGFTIEKNDLPKLSVTDKICQYYSFQSGDIIEITRTCGTQQPQKYYRIVSNNI